MLLPKIPLKQNKTDSRLNTKPKRHSQYRTCSTSRITTNTKSIELGMTQKFKFRVSQTRTSPQINQQKRRALRQSRTPRQQSIKYKSNRSHLKRIHRLIRNNGNKNSSQQSQGQLYKLKLKETLKKVTLKGL